MNDDSESICMINGEHKYVESRWQDHVVLFCEKCGKVIRRDVSAVALDK